MSYSILRLKDRRDIRYLRYDCQEHHKETIQYGKGFYHTPGDGTACLSRFYIWDGAAYHRDNILKNVWGH